MIAIYCNIFYVIAIGCNRTQRKFFSFSFFSHFKTLREIFERFKSCHARNNI